MNFRLIKILTSIGLFAIMVFVLLTLQEHLMIYTEKHNLFLFTAEYTEHTLHQQGLLTWLAAFVVQFYHIPWLGASIIGGMMVGTYLLTESIIKKLTGLRDYLQLGIILCGYLYTTFDKVDTTPGLFTLVFLSLAAFRIVLLAVPQLPWTKNSVSDRKKMKPVLFAIPLLLAAGYIAFGYVMAVKEFNPHERAMIMADKAANDKDWNKVIKITEQYLNARPNNKLMIYLRSLALANQGILLEKLLDYPMKGGVDAIIFPWNGDSRTAEVGNLVHEYTGNINEATHWAFESMVIWGENATNLINLAKYNIAIGKPKVAQKFVNKLKHSLFYRKEADSLQRQILGMEPSQVNYAFSTDSIASQPIIDFNPAKNLKRIVEHDPSNNVARQYFLASLILLNDQDALIDNLEPGSKYPPIIEQAMLIYSLYPDSTPLDHLGLELSQKCKDDYGRYRDMIRNNQTFDERKVFGNSFWYYIGHICPYGVRKQSTLASPDELSGKELKH